MAASHVVTNGFGLGGTGAIPFYVTLGYGDYAAAVAETPAAPAGGMRVRRLTPLVNVQGRVTSPDGTLYRQMFPDKAVAATPTERSDKGLPVALLMAWMAAFDE